MCSKVWYRIPDRFHEPSLHSVCIPRIIKLFGDVWKWTVVTFCLHTEEKEAKAKAAEEEKKKEEEKSKEADKDKDSAVKLTT